MKKRNKINFIIPLVIISTMIIGCKSSKPKEDPTAFINGYHQNLKDNNFEAAYDKLSSMSKKNMSKEDFITWKTLCCETMQIKETKIEKSSEGKNKKIDGTKYKKSIEYTIVEKSNDLYEGKEVTDNYKQNVVMENGKWKLYRGAANGKEMIASEYNSIGMMYADGKGKEKNLNEAASMFNKGLEYDKNCSLLYYGLGYVYNDLERYDDSIKALDTYLLKETDDKEKSDAYDIKGLDYVEKGLMDDAKKMFNKALELNPNNEYAKTHLNSVSSSNNTPPPIANMSKTDAEKILNDKLQVQSLQKFKFFCNAIQTINGEDYYWGQLRMYNPSSNNWNLGGNEYDRYVNSKTGKIYTYTNSTLTLTDGTTTIKY